MERHFKKMLQTMAILSVIVLASGNLMSGSFQTCNLQCSNDESVPPVTDDSPSTRSLLRGKSGPRGSKGARGDDGVKGEPGVSCDRSEIEQLTNRLSQLEAKSDMITITPKFKLEYCGVGLQSVDSVHNDQITASSIFPNSPINQAAYNGRLFASTGYGGWGSHYNRANEWIQVDLEEDKTIHGVATQGRPSPSSYVTSYTVLYKANGSNSFLPIVNESGEALIFQGNVDATTAVTNNFPGPITARYFRINVLTWHLHICLRFDLLTC